MKRITIFSFFISMMLIISSNTYAFFSVVSAPAVEANQAADMSYSISQDIMQNLKEIKKLANMAQQIGQLQHQIAQVRDVIEDNRNILDQATTLVDYHGNWENLSTVEIIDEVFRTSDQKMNTAKSILEDISDSPENVVNKTDVLKSYIGEIDAENWTIQKSKDSKDYIMAESVALKQYGEYEDFRLYIHGDGSDKGELNRLNEKLRLAKLKLELAKTDTVYTARYAEIIELEKQIDYLLDKEEDLRNRYMIASTLAEDSKKMQGMVTTLRLQKAHNDNQNDDISRLPTRSALLKYLQEKEKDAIL